MPTVAALGTSFNLPNYHGRVHQLTRSNTPFLTALMGREGIGGGEVEITDSRTFEWQTFDLRSAAQNTVVDGDSAGTGEVRSRSNVFNTLQTHREDVNVAYEKLGHVSQFDGQNIGGGNPVNDEGAWQITQMWKQIKNDMNYSAINGTYVLPADNNTAAQTRGILEAITTNARESLEDAQDWTGEDVDDTVDLTGHGYDDGDDVTLSNLTGGSNLTEGTRYYVINSAANSFQLATTKGGSAVSFGSDVTAGEVAKYGTPTEESVDNLMQDASDNGGLIESEMGLLICNSGLLRWLTKIYVKDKSLEKRSRNIGGANVTNIITPFGELGLMYDHNVPQGTLLAVSLDQCVPHFRLVPNKGVMFAEPIAKDGASNKTQLYTSFGLEYGNEAAHAKDTGFTANAPAS